MAGALYLHVGTRKSGTTTLQDICRANQGRLRAAGVGFPFGVPLGKNRARFSASMRQLREGSSPQELMRQMRDAVRKTPRDTAFFSAETLADVSAVSIDRLHEALDGIDLHIVVTGRDYARQVPSEWQQACKLGAVPAYATFCERITQPEDGLARKFKERYDLSDIARRWGNGLAPDKVHLIVLPQVSGDYRWLPRVFFDLMGVDADALRVPDVPRNPSLSYSEAEVMRRAAAMLSSNSGSSGLEVLALIRKTRSNNHASSSDPITVSEETLQWCREQADGQVAAIREGGWSVIGDLEDIRPRADLSAAMPHDDLEKQLSVAIDHMARLMAVEIDRTRTGSSDGRAGRTRPGEAKGILSALRRRITCARA
jgi:hypothetical protein